jgi:hypothetical protein
LNLFQFKVFQWKICNLWKTLFKIVSNSQIRVNLISLLNIILMTGSQIDNNLCFKISNWEWNFTLTFHVLKNFLMIKKKAQLRKDLIFQTLFQNFVTSNSQCENVWNSFSCPLAHLWRRAWVLKHFFDSFLLSCPNFGYKLKIKIMINVFLNFKKVILK